MENLRRRSVDDADLRDMQGCCSLRRSRLQSISRHNWTTKVAQQYKLFSASIPMLVGLFAIQACGGDSTTAPMAPDPPRPTTVMATPATVGLPALDALAQLTARGA